MQKLVWFALLVLPGCGEDVSAHVDCVTTAAPAVECDVKQTKGKSEIEVCWDFTVTCANGAVVRAANTCQKVKDGGTAKVTIPADKLDGVDQCGGDRPPTGTLTNMTINGKATTK
jgi:hypothetical protein